MAWVTAMAAGGEQTRSAHARDVSLGARIHKFRENNLENSLWNVSETTPHLSIHRTYTGDVAPNGRGGLSAAPGLHDVIQGLELRRAPRSGNRGCVYLSHLHPGRNYSHLVVKFSWTYHWAINRREVILNRFQNIKRGLTKWSGLQC